MMQCDVSNPASMHAPCRMELYVNDRCLLAYLVEVELGNFYDGLPSESAQAWTHRRDKVCNPQKSFHYIAYTLACTPAQHSLILPEHHISIGLKPKIFTNERRSTCTSRYESIGAAQQTWAEHSRPLMLQVKEVKITRSIHMPVQEVDLRQVCHWP